MTIKRFVLDVYPKQFKCRYIHIHGKLVSSLSVGDDPVSPHAHMYANSTTFGIAPGYEMHFDGTDNLSPYFGVEAYFITNSRTDDLEFWGPNDIDDMKTNDYIIWTLETPNLSTIWV